MRELGVETESGDGADRVHRHLKIKFKKDILTRNEFLKEVAGLNLDGVRAAVDGGECRVGL